MTSPHLIRSRENDFFKQIKSYQSAKYRKQDSCLIADGEKTYQEALTKLQLRHTIISESYLQAHPQTVEEYASKLTVFADNIFESISEFKTSQGILGIFELPIFDAEMSKFSRVVLLENVQDPKNVGAIIRTAHCLDFEAVFLGEGCAAPFSPKVIRSSMGSVFHLPVLSCAIENQIRDLKDADFTIVGTALSGNTEVRNYDKIALIVGSEGGGLSSKTRALCDDLFRIEINSSAESLNASVASGIAMYLFNDKSG